jgi:beta-N-acetylhexosaminidase
MQLTHEQQIGQLLMVGFRGTTAPDYLLDWLKQGRVGGVILFARNVESPGQLAALTRSLHEASPIPILISIDQEGGRVARMRWPQGFIESPGAMALSASPEGIDHSNHMSSILGSEMHTMGINWTYAPVVDITYNADNPTVGTRSYGDDMTRISDMAVAATQGFQARKVAACAKHFPGLGNTAVDSHLALPVIEGVSVEQLLATDMVPYRAVVEAGIASIMTTHTLFTALDEEYPATLSGRIIKKLLREELGFDGVVTTDCLEMKAIADHYTPAQSALMAINAAVDVALFSHTREMQEAAYEGLLSAAANGDLAQERIDEANRRITALKAAYSVNLMGIEPPRSGTVWGAMSLESIKIARSGIVTLTPDTVQPLDRSGIIGLVEFIPYVSSEVMETAGETLFSTLLSKKIPGLVSIFVQSVNPTEKQERAALELAQSVDTLIVATRNAHMVPRQHQLAEHLLTHHPPTILCCLRNPYDAGTLSAQTVYATCGDSYPSLSALANVLIEGAVTPGVLPVSLEIAQ